MAMIEFEEETLWDKVSWRIGVVKDWFRNWVWPAWHLRNWLWRRYDLVRLGKMSRILKCHVRRTEYSDVLERMLFANAEMIREFVEDEDPERYVEWYGKYGHRYGDYDGPTMFPDRKGEYVMDLIKECHRFWTAELPNMKDEADWLLGFWANHLYFKKEVPCENPKGCAALVDDEEKYPKDLSAFDGEEMRWDILDRICGGDRSKILEKGFVSRRHAEMEAEMERKCQYYLHLGIELRPYLWT